MPLMIKVLGFKVKLITFNNLTGREYDEHGNLHQWWNNRTIEIFNNRTKCFVDQYSKYQLFGKNINGKQTLGKFKYFQCVSGFFWK